MISEVYNIDCVEYMKTIEDKFFDLAIVDPPYGLDLANMNMGAGKSKKSSKIENGNLKIGIKILQITYIFMN